MRAPRIFILIVTLLAACDRVTVALVPDDPLAAEIERWSASLENRPAEDKLKQQVQPVLARAEEALGQGKRLLALQSLVAAREELAVAAYMGGRPAEQRKDMAAFEAEWARMGDTLKKDSPAKPEDLHPAAARALGEAALPQVRIYYDASLEYGRNTMPEQGLYYLGSAQAQREVVDLLGKVSVPSSRREPPLRPLRPELDALEAEMLAVYRPPVSIERHKEFIAASSTLKEARELDEAGLRHGALLRYLQAAHQFAPLRGASPTSDTTALEKRLSQGDVDHSIGQLFLESGQADALPRYFAALEPARPQEPGPAPKVTVTLVRWPYT
ncbi:MAG TPA: hypothetical protein VNM67_25435 [Thermoanaerobaculia bacterium]|nr:hypothetical protein [Thermoanaerobaculia bacterium]